MAASNNYVVIMAGGIGSRFWPVSRIDYPKQFLDILGMGSTLIQQTFKRFEKMVPAANIFVVTSNEYVPIVEQQLPLIPNENIISEPLRRNTAPCIAYACFKIVKKNPAASIIVAPSDHLIPDVTSFSAVCNIALKFIELNPALVTLGIKPSHPNTGYGYIQKQPVAFATNVYPVKQFIEKPYLEMAKSFLQSDEFFWNAGIFIWKAKDVLAAFQQYLPEMFGLFASIQDDLNTPAESEAVKEVYLNCSDVSIDIAVMEKSANVYMIPAPFEWSDLGTWDSVWQNMQKDYLSNAVAGDNIMVIDATQCMVHAPGRKLILLQGLHDFIIVDTKDVLLICKRENEQEIKKYTTELKMGKGENYLYTPS